MGTSADICLGKRSSEHQVPPPPLSLPGLSWKLMSPGRFMNQWRPSQSWLRDCRMRWTPLLAQPSGSSTECRIYSAFVLACLIFDNQAFPVNRITVEQSLVFCRCAMIPTSDFDVSGSMRVHSATRPSPYLVWASTGRDNPHLRKLQSQWAQQGRYRMCHQSWQQDHSHV